MKQIIIYTIQVVILAICLFSCDDNRLNDIPDDQIYLVQSGETVYKISNKESKYSFEIAIYKSGLNRGATDVQIIVDPSLIEKYNSKNGTAYKILPAEYYTIGQTEFHFGQEKNKDFTNVEIDITSLGKLQGIRNKEYVLPIKLNTTGEVSLVADKSELLLVPELTGGIRANSATVIWSKTLDEMGINGTNHNTTSIAVTDKHLYVNTRSEDLKYYDRFTGEYVGAIELPFKGGLTNFIVTNDDANNLLITNLRTSDASPLSIYRIKDNGAPEIFIEAVENTIVAGRKLRITGDLDANAIITSNIANSSRIVYWEVKNGVLTSQEPQIYDANAGQIQWANNCSAIPVSTDLNDGLLLAGNGNISSLGLFDKDGNIVYSYDLVAAGISPIGGEFMTHAIAKATFNGATYLAVGSLRGNEYATSRLLDITEMSNLSLDPNSPEVLAYKALEPSLTTVNTNVTGDVQLKVSKEKETMVMYLMGTNGSVVATQFDSKVE